MAMYQFEFIGRDGRVDVASDVLPDVEEARDHCRELFEGLGRATGTRCIRVRSPRGQILYAWPETGGAGAVDEPAVSRATPTRAYWQDLLDVDVAA